MPSLSPGVYWQERDFSAYVPALNSTQFGMVGVATKGPVNVRSFVSSIDQFTKKFGTPASGMYGVYAALEYLREGNGLWFVRAQSSTTPAAEASVSIALVDGTTAVNAKAKDPGTYYNGLKLTISHRLPANVAETKDVTITGTSQNMTVTKVPLVPGTVKVTVGADEAIDNGDGAFAADGNITGGTINYKTGAIVLNFTTTSVLDLVMTGKYYTAFDFVIARTVSGRDYVLETHRNMVMLSTSESYYATILANSQLMAVPALSTHFPDAQTLTFASGTDGTSGITDSDYIGTRVGSAATGLQLLAVPSEVDINGLACPGITSNAVVQELVAICEARRDCVAVIDTPDNLLPEDAVDWADGNNAYAANAGISSSYASVYYPWVRTTDAYNNNSEVFVPPSGFVAAAYARADREPNLSAAPAGAVRGKMLGSTGARLLLSEQDRGLLYSNRINPITDFPIHGMLIFGQKTAQTFPSALDRVGTRRMLIRVEKSIVTGLIPFVFEAHTQRTWTRVRHVVEPYLEARAAAEDIYPDFRVVVSAANNPPSEIDQNRLHVDIYLKPIKYAEEILVSFNILPTGANIDEYISPAK